MSRRHNAEDRAVLVDETLLPLWNQVSPHVKVPAVVVMGATKSIPEGAHEYEALLAAAKPAMEVPDPDERDATAMCYTTGTTGKPKGVLYSHRSLVLTQYFELERGARTRRCSRA